MVLEIVSLLWVWFNCFQSQVICLKDLLESLLCVEESIFSKRRFVCHFLYSACYFNLLVNSHQFQCIGTIQLPVGNAVIEHQPIASYLIGFLT